MDRLAKLLLPGFALAVSCASAHAQDPVKPPPWWRVNDEVTVSVHWNFDTPFAPGQPQVAPTYAVVPTWFDNPAQVTDMIASPNLTWIPTLAGHIGCAGLVGNGTQGLSATLELIVDNDPHLDWVKVFWFQFDQFEGPSGNITKEIEQQLNKYGRAIVSSKSEALGAGWARVTVEAQLIPQPDDEKIDWSFVEDAFGTVAIDNLFVSSRCIKPNPDERGDALGKVTTPPINLTVQTGGRTCRAAASTQGPATAPLKRYWIGAQGLTPTAAQQLFQLTEVGTVVGTPVSLPSTALVAPLGITDLCVETLRDAAGNVLQEILYAIVDGRSSGGAVRLLAFDAHNNGQPVPALDVVLAGFPLVAQQRFGLAFDPDGNLGAGSFWVSTRQTSTPGAYPAFEFDRSGSLIDTVQMPAGGGLAYDEALGRFYFFSDDPTPSPSGPIQVTGIEVSAYDHQATGTTFCGDLTLATAGVTRGGVALGIEAYRLGQGTTGTPGSELRLVCVADVGGQQWLYEVAGPFAFGYSRFGRCGMRNGPPFLGGNFDVTLQGVPDSLLAVLFLGGGNTAIPVGIEAFASIVPDVNSALVAPTQPGSFALTVNVPPNAALAYAPTFFQWIVFDSTAPGLLGFSQAGKTVLYP